MSAPDDAAPEDIALFDLRAARFAAEGREILHPLTMRLRPGRVIGLIGHNGSGKSTLLKLLARQQAPSGGTIHFAGRALAAWRERDFARHVAYLPQQPPPAPGLLVRELVALGRYPWHGALHRFDAKDRLKRDEAIVLADLASLEGRMVETLSGGERQRAWLAMLLAQDARCLLLDEPISALDIAHQVEVLDLIRRLATDRGLSVVVVLHDVNMAARICDELVALRAGKLLDRGPARAVLDPERLRAVYGIAMGIVAHPRTGAPIAHVL